MCIEGDYLGKGKPGALAWRTWCLNDLPNGGFELEPSCRWVGLYTDLPKNPWRTKFGRAPRVDHFEHGDHGLHAVKRTSGLPNPEDPVWGRVIVRGDIAEFEDGYLATMMEVARLYVNPEVRAYPFDSDVALHAKEIAAALRKRYPSVRVSVRAVRS